MARWQLVDKTIARLSLELKIPIPKAKEIIGLDMEENIPCLVLYNQTIAKILRWDTDIVNELNRLQEFELYEY